MEKMSVSSLILQHTHDCTNNLGLGVEEVVEGLHCSVHAVSDDTVEELHL